MPDAHELACFPDTLAASSLQVCGMSSWLACSERADALREKALEYKARGHLDMYATTLAESQNLAERYVQQLQPASAPGVAMWSPELYSRPSTCFHLLRLNRYKHIHWAQ